MTRAAKTRRTSAHPSSGARSGRHNTAQQTLIADLLAHLDRFHSAQQIHGLLARRGDIIGLATVYRTLERLAGDGHLDTVVSEDGRTLYRHCSNTAHHHLVCRICGRTVEVLGPDIEIWVEHHARHHRYADVKHTVEIFGTCPACEIAHRLNRAVEPASEFGVLHSGSLMDELE